MASCFPSSAMADPAEENVVSPPPTPAAPAVGASDPPLQPAADSATTEKVSAPAPEVRSRGFRLLGEDTSVHKSLGGGKSTYFFLHFSADFLPVLQLIVWC